MKTFNLGLTMAGAVSAGSYTGGVLDYLFEVLHKWELAKEGKLEGIDFSDVPHHDVVIDVMGGTSAGGMATIMAAYYAIKNEVNPIKDTDAGKIGGHRDNIFYDSWVNMLDDDKSTTLEKALLTDDLTRYEAIRSLLNSDFIDGIADRALSEINSDRNPTEKLPKYISSDLEMLIAHAMLRGIPLKVAFSKNSTLSDPPVHTSYEHFLMSHFKLNHGNACDPKRYMWLNPYDEKSRKQLLEAAKATGAFPFGLINREFGRDHFNEDYLKTSITRMLEGDFSLENPESANYIDWKDSPVLDYFSGSIDGGAINNEPYGEVKSIMERRCGGATLYENEFEYQKYGIVMIDPFPDFYETATSYEYPKNIFGLTPQVIKTLWNQSKVKRREMIDQFDDNEYRGQIYPRKYDVLNDGRPLDYPIATGHLSGFSGFLDISYRHHDFYLGRNNARNFVRAFLSLPYDETKGEQGIHPIHRNWTDQQRKRFKITFNNGKSYLPIIPDMNMLLKNIDSKAEASTYSIPELPTISPSKIDNLENPTIARMNKLLDYFPLALILPKPKKKGFLFSLFNSIGNWLINFYKRRQIRKMVKSNLNKLSEFLKGHGLME
ncbi:hypothetical protein GYB22_09440 [bacterium]|nr:hypothetical protein [bacterium]